jgi:TolB-like protein
VAPRDVRPGTQYADAIVRAINEAEALVLVLSANAVASAHVGKEVERASSKRKPIITFRIDAAPLSPALEYFLSESQWIDVPAWGMPTALAKLAETAAAEAMGQVEPGRAAPSDVTVKTISPTANQHFRWMFAALAFVVVGIAVALGAWFWPPHHRTLSTPATATSPATGGAGTTGTVISDKSIAVLPFVDMSEKHDQEYFADGMAEEILDLLTKIPGLTVIGRTSSFDNAAYVLEGSVRRSTDQVRITAQLINTKTGAHEWSETYDRPIGNELKLQDAIAAGVVRELQLTVVPGTDTRVASKNREAYDLYLRGRHAADRFDAQGLDDAVTLLKQALDREATSAVAAAELAFAYYVQGAFGFLAPATAFEQARRAAATALKIDPRSARAHYVLGKINTVYDWDWAAAEREFQQVAILSPGSAEALNGEARVSLALGHWDDAFRQGNAALGQDPLDPGSFQALSLIQASSDGDQVKVAAIQPAKEFIERGGL